MGIPGFFGFIRKYNQNGEIIKATLPFPKCSLFLDFNGAIYTAYYKYKHKSMDSIINNVLNYLDILVKIHTEKNELTDNKLSNDNSNNENYNKIANTSSNEDLDIPTFMRNRNLN